MAAINFADSVRLGSGQASKVYLGSTQVWPQFQPNNLAGCAVWLDASKLHLTSGQVPSPWPNLGSGSQPITRNYPAVRSNALNGLPVVKFFQSDRVRFPSGTGVDKDWTLVYYARKWQLTSPGRVVTALSTVANILVGFHGNEMDQCYVEGWLTSGSSPTHTTQWRMYSADSTSSAPARFFVNKTLAASGAVTPAKGWGGTLYINGYNDDTDGLTAQATDCELAELVLYNRKLSDVERVQVEDYLSAKWGVPELFKPTDLGNKLLVWLDGADAASVVVTGSGVSQWNNKGTHYGTFTQTTDASKPTYVDQTIRFQQLSSQRLLFSASIAPYDVILIARPHQYQTGPEIRAGFTTDWKTLLLGNAAPIIIEPTSASRFGTYHAGFFPAGGNFVPAMTSNSAPAPYAAAASGEWSDGNYPPWKAFNPDPNLAWHSDVAVPAWIQIDCGAPVWVGSYKYQPRPSPGQVWRSWTFDGWTGSAWVRLDTVTDTPNFSPGEKRTYVCDTPGAFRWLRWTISASWGTHAEAGVLELYGDVGANATPLAWGGATGIGFGRFAVGATSYLSRDGGPMVATGAFLANNVDVVFQSFGANLTSQPWGDIREAIFLDGNNEPYRPTLEGYLAHKWGYTFLLPTNHPFKNVRP